MNPAGDPLEVDCYRGAQPDWLRILPFQESPGDSFFRSLKVPSLHVLQQGNWDCHLERAVLSPYSYIPFWTWPRFILYLRWACVSGSVSMCRVRNGLLYVISKGLNLVVVLGSVLAAGDTMALMFPDSLTKVFLSSMISLVPLYLRTEVSRMDGGAVWFPKPMKTVVWPLLQTKVLGQSKSRNNFL